MNERSSTDASGVASTEPMGYGALLSLLGDKDRASLERQIQAYETKFGAALAQRWRDLACILMTLAPARPKVTGSNIMQFYIPDGVYRKQVFAFQALNSGVFKIYMPDVLEQAVRAGLLSKWASDNGAMGYRLSQSGDILGIDTLDGQTPNLEACYKDLTGWNRKAMRVTLPADSSDAQIGAVGQLCALAAAEWA